MNINIYIYACICIYMYVNTYIYIHTYQPTDANKETYMHIHTYLCVYVCKTYIRTCMCTLTQMPSTYTHTNQKKRNTIQLYSYYTYINADIHIYKQNVHSAQTTYKKNMYIYKHIKCMYIIYMYVNIYRYVLYTCQPTNAKKKHLRQ